MKSNLECLYAIEISLLYNLGEEFLDRFCGLECCVVKMMFAVKMVNNKVVGKLFIYIVLKFQSNRPKGLGFIAV